MKKLTLLLHVAAFMSISAYGQVIVTVAGTGSTGHTGDGGPAITAAIGQPTGIAFDTLGNMLFGENYNNYVRKISGGIITTIAGLGGGGYTGDGGPATLAALSNPQGMLVDSAGNILIADCANHTVRTINTAGIISSTTLYATQVADVAIDRKGNLLGADVTGHKIRKRDAAGTVTVVAGTGAIGLSGDGGPATAATVWQPEGICVDLTGNIYIGDFYNHRIRKIDTFGIITTIAGSGPSGPGIGSFSGDGGPATLARLNQPQGITTDSAGNIYFCDRNNNRVRKIDVSGIITTVAGNGAAAYSGDGCMATDASLNLPEYLALDKYHNLYISDYINGRIRKIVNAHRIYFTGGHTQSLSVCESAAPAPINALLTVFDPEAGQTVTWSLLSAPAHGTALASFTTTSTGGALVPTALTYTPLPGYLGNDTFTVAVSDCGAATDTTTIIVSTLPLPHAGVIAGPGSLCVGNTITLTDTSTGGVWNCTNAKATISGGSVTGAMPGIDTITYIVTNTCGADTALFEVTINPCTTGLPVNGGAPGQSLFIYPNPNDGTCTVHLSTTNAEHAAITVTDVLGRCVYRADRKAILNGDIDLEMPQLKNGIYWMNVQTGDTRYATRLLIVR